MDIHSEEEGVVSFLNGSKLKEDTCKWPLRGELFFKSLDFHDDLTLNSFATEFLHPFSHSVRISFFMQEKLRVWLQKWVYFG